MPSWAAGETGRFISAPSRRGIKDTGRPMMKPAVDGEVGDRFTGRSRSTPSERILDSFIPTGGREAGPREQGIV